VALARVLSLLEAKAAVTVVSPQVLSELEQLHREGSIQWLRKEIEEADYADAFLIIAATDRPEVNQQIYEKVKDTKLVNVASDSASGNVHLPAVLTRGRLQISVATGGASPMLAKRIRDDLGKIYDESYEEYMEFLHTVRMKVKQSALPQEQKLRLYAESLKEIYKKSVEERNKWLAELQKLVQRDEM
jgi:precorrin-2 dehydrogenase/sirohydrochlorin ferrochelatase